MLKYFLFLIILLHGLIHFMGFSKAFGYGNIPQFSKDISKPAGILWLVSAFLFTAAAIIFLLKKDSWPLIGIIAAILSQFLIILSWKDAKFGTFANLIILVVAVIAFANFRFNKMADAEAKEIFAKVQSSEKIIITKEMLYGLPAVVQKWLTRSNIVGKENIKTISLHQKGKMKTKPGANWIKFEANQYFTVDDPAFVWKAKVEMMPLISLAGRDKFEKGKGSLLIKALSLLTIAKTDDNEKVNSASMIRYLAETSWFPTAAISKYIKWEAADSATAKATMTYGGLTVSGIFSFNESGDMTAFAAERYYGTDKNATKEKWYVQNTGWKDFNGIRIPNKASVTWKLKDGDFNWADMEITNLVVNSKKLYK